MENLGSRVIVPGHLRLGATELGRRAEAALDRLADCDLCARYCRVDRTAGIKGAVCRTGRKAVVSSAFPHMGEEAPLTGWRGSGTIFFTWCNMRCVFCQNWEISHAGEGDEISADDLAATMLRLQAIGCHNINFVSPSHVVAQILEALAIAARHDFRLPLVYNTGGYDSPAALELLDGVIDIYMPDVKYGDSDPARKYSKIRDYTVHNQAAVREMHRQVGDLFIGEDGIAKRGLLVRHLVMPGNVAGSEAVMDFLAGEISTDTYLNVMAQYRPCYKAGEHQAINRRPTMSEYQAAVECAHARGLKRLSEH